MKNRLEKAETLGLHKDPTYNSPEIQRALSEHGLRVSKSSVVADAFRLGYVAALRAQEKGR